MTKILLSAIVTDMRNSTAGTTFTKNRYGNVLKTKQTPVKQNTAYQNAWRQIQSNVARSWKDLTEEQRLTWVNAVSNFPYQDKFGVTRYLSGFALYQQLSLNLRIISEAPNFTAPEPVSVNSPDITETVVSWDYPNQRYEIIFVYSTPAGGENEKVAVYATQPGSAGKMVVGSTIYFIGSYAGDLDEADISADFASAFPVVSPGSKSFFALRRINVNTGQSGVRQTLSVIFPDNGVYFSVNVVDGLGWNFFITFGSSIYIVPTGTKVILGFANGTGSPPTVPPPPIVPVWDTVLAGTETDPYFKSDNVHDGSEFWIWWRMDLVDSVSESVLYTNYFLAYYSS